MRVLNNIAYLIFLIFIFISAIVPPPAFGAKEDNGFWSYVGDSIANVWTKGAPDIYVPAYAWHNRFMYDRGRTKKYNEYPWGLGLGKSYFDGSGNQHALLALGFMDSNDHFQPVVGYSHLWYWEIARELSFGLGAAAGFSARYEWYYIPFPAALPLVSLQYKNLAMHATYIPEARNRGNVMFVILRWHFN